MMNFKKLTLGLTLLGLVGLVAVYAISYYVLHFTEQWIVQAVPALGFLDRHILQAIVDVGALVLVRMGWTALLPFSLRMRGSSVTSRPSKFPRIARVGVLSLFALGPAMTSVIQYVLERPNPDHLFGSSGAQANLCRTSDGTMILASLDTAMDFKTGAPCTPATPDTAAVFQAQGERQSKDEHGQGGVQLADAGSPTPAPTPAPQPKTSTAKQVPASPAAGTESTSSFWTTVSEWFHWKNNHDNPGIRSSNIAPVLSKQNPTGPAKPVVFTARVPESFSEKTASEHPKSSSVKRQTAVECACTCDDSGKKAGTEVASAEATRLQQTSAQPYQIKFRNQTGAWIYLHVPRSGEMQSYSLAPGAIHEEQMDRSITAVNYTAEATGGVAISWKGTLSLAGLDSYIVDLDQPTGYVALTLKNVSDTAVQSIEVNGQTFPLGVPPDSKYYVMGLFPTGASQQVTFLLHFASGKTQTYTLMTSNTNGHQALHAIIKRSNDLLAAE